MTTSDGEPKECSASEKTDRKPSKKSFSKKIGLAFLVIILLGGSFLVWKNYQLNKELERLVQPINQKLSERSQRLKELEKQGNAVADFINATNLIPSSVTEMKMPDGFPATAWSEKWIKEESLLKDCQNAIDAAKISINNEHGFFWFTSFNDSFPLSSALKMHKLLLLDALHLEKEGKTEEAAQQMFLLLRTGRLFSQEGPLITALVGRAQMILASDALSGIAHRRHLSKDFLIKLSNGIEDELRLFPTFDSTLDIEYLFMEKGLADLANGSNPDEKHICEGISFIDKLPVIYKWNIVEGMSEINEFFDLRHKSLDKNPEAILQLKQFMVDLRNNKKSVFVQMALISLDGLDKKYKAFDAQSCAARIILGIESYRMAKGKYPEQLEELAPDYLRELPMDPVNNKQFVYKPEKDDYQLYSLGSDGKEDGAKKVDDKCYTPWNKSKE